MSNRTVLVVDDSSTIRKIIQRELAKADFEVLLARNGREALSLLEWADPLPDLITLDIDMPKMDGFEVCRRIREHGEMEEPHSAELAKIPVIFISANDTAETRRRGYELGIIDFISKPFAPGKMLATVNAILNAQEQFADMTALIVEDSPFVRRIVRNILARHGLTIFEVASGDEALEVVKKESFAIDIVITDYIMPGMSGEELCRTLRSLEAMEQVPIFFISSVETKDSVLGFFKVGANDYLPKPFTEEEFRARVLTHLRNRKYVRELERLNAQLKFHAEHDALTGLYNRGFFQKELEPRFVQALYGNEDLSCILVDMDYFKRVNDSYGHAYGDMVLVEFARLLLADRRDDDIAARYGGEEFVLLLPNTSLDDTVTIAETLRRSAEGHIYDDGTTEMQVTISIGVSSLLAHRPKSPDKLLSMADQALYTAKESGRNRVTVFPP